jgi:uncharacterized membrane protein
MSTFTTTSKQNAQLSRLQRFTYWFSRHWLFVFGVLLAIYIGLPWLAPLAMQMGWTTLGQAIYLGYATQCHQLPQRSIFLFGPQAMYSLNDIQAAWQITNNPMILRQFVGDSELGWKVAWSDRMVYMYGSLLFFGLLYAPLRRRIRPLSVWIFALFLLPMAVDGVSHAISDFAGVGAGFRDHNAWLVTLTGNRLPAGFYAGDALGSFNSWMRFLSGLFFGLGVAWLALPRLESGFTDTVEQLEAREEQRARKQGQPERNRPTAQRKSL